MEQTTVIGRWCGQLLAWQLHTQNGALLHISCLHIYLWSAWAHPLPNGGAASPFYDHFLRCVSEASQTPFASILVAKSFPKCCFWIRFLMSFREFRDCFRSRFSAPLPEADVQKTYKNTVFLKVFWRSAFMLTASQSLENWLQEDCK